MLGSVQMKAGRGLVVLLALALFAFVPALKARAADIKFPALTGRVVDDAHMLSDAQVQDLTAKLKALEDKNGRQLVVVTLPSLQDQTIEDYGYQLGRAWGIGQKGQNNGVLFLIAPNEKKVRIEVGYGLEPVLTDALSSILLQEKVLPRFRQGDMAQGIVDGTDALVEQLGLDDATAHQKVVDADANLAKTRALAAHRPRGSPIGAVISLIVVFFVIQSVLRGRGGWFLPFLLLGSLGRGGRDDGWGGGGGFGGDGGGFSGGGGSFGGGGSSGDW